MSIVESVQSNTPVTREIANHESFDYAGVKPSVANCLRGQADRIRKHFTSSIIQVGKALLESKRHLSHGAFLSWVERGVAIPARTAQTYMRIAIWAKDKSATVAHLPPSVLYILSKTGVPEDFVAEILNLAESGERLAPSAIRSKLKAQRNEWRIAAAGPIQGLLGLAVFAALLFVLSGNMAAKVRAQELTADQDIASKNQVALPDNITVDLPGIDVPKEIAGFSGAWAGDGWNGIIPTSLVVEKIDKEGSANAIFSWGDIAKPVRQRGWLQVSAIVDQGRLTFSIPDYGKAEFSLTSDGKLLGRFTYTNGARYFSLLERIAPATVQNVVDASRKMLSWEVVIIPLASNANREQPVLLRGLLYRSPVEGRKPIAIFSGDSAFSDQFRAHPNLAPIRSRQMLSLGYSVLVLQRKGMGGSGGTFMEPRDESIPQLKQLQSALDDLDAAVKFVKQLDYVDPSRIVLIGLNRGALLSVSYAGLHDGVVAGVINTAGNWRVSRSWWQQLFSWGDFTTNQLAAAGKNTKISMLWLYGDQDPTALEYARKNYQGFVQAGGKGTFVVVSDADKEDRALSDYVLNIR